MANKKSYNSAQGVAEGLPRHTVYDTAAEMPSSGLQEGDTAYSKDDNVFYKATSATTWVAITGGGASAFSDLTGTASVAQGGTNASSASGARTNLGLGDVSTLNTNASTVNFLRGDGTWVTPSAGSVAASDITGSLSLVTQSGLLPLSRGVLETLSMLNGGTGASNASVARTNLGLGSLATASSIVLTTDTTGTLSVASGGTNASNATDARTNLGLGSIATLSSIVLPTNTSGTLSVAQGGTGASSGTGAYTNLGQMSASNISGSISLLTQSGLLPGATGISGLISTANLGTGTGTDSKFLKGDQTWGLPSAGSVAASDVTGSLSLIAQSGLLPLARGTSGTLSVASGGTGVSSNTGTGNQNVLSTSPTFITNINLPAGDATNAPLVFASGSAQTTSGAGTITYNGKIFMGSPVASEIGVVPTIQWLSNTASVAIATNTIALQSPFSANNDTFTVSANTTYYMEGLIELTGMTATSRITAFALGGTAGSTNVKYKATISTGAANTVTTTNSVSAQVVKTTRNLNATVTTAASLIEIRGILRVSTAGTVIPQFSHSAILGGTANCIQGSYFYIMPLGSDTTAKVGNIA